MHPHRFSVIMPVYNHADLLTESIEAVLQQTRLPDEYIILDDGSTDATWSIISHYCNQHSFIKPIRLEKNQGLLVGLKILLDSVTGDYMCAAAADDRLHPELVAKSCAAASEFPDAGIHFGTVWSMSQDGVIQTTGRNVFEPWSEITFLNPKQFLNDFLLMAPFWYSPSPGTFFRMDALREVGGFRPELGAWADTFAVQAIGLKYGACFLPDTGSYFRNSPNGFSQTQLRNGSRFLEIVGRAAALMRSREFHGVFPSEYVTRWENLYREHMLKDILRRVAERYKLAGRQYRDSFPGTLPLLARVLMKLTGLFRQSQLAYLRHVLNRYRGS